MVSDVPYGTWTPLSSVELSLALPTAVCEACFQLLDIYLAHPVTVEIILVFASYYLPALRCRSGFGTSLKPSRGWGCEARWDEVSGIALVARNKGNVNKRLPRGSSVTDSQRVLCVKLSLTFDFICAAHFSLTSRKLICFLTWFFNIMKPRGEVDSPGRGVTTLIGRLLQTERSKGVVCSVRFIEDS
jgi:hypothetical protein